MRRGVETFAHAIAVGCDDRSPLASVITAPTGTSPRAAAASASARARSMGVGPAVGHDPGRLASRLGAPKPGGETPGALSTSTLNASPMALASVSRNRAWRRVRCCSGSARCKSAAVLTSMPRVRRKSALRHRTEDIGTAFGRRLAEAL